MADTELCQEIVRGVRLIDMHGSALTTNFLHDQKPSGAWTIFLNVQRTALMLGI